MDALNQQVNAAIMTALRGGMRIEDILSVLSMQEHSLRNAIQIVNAIHDHGRNPC